MTVLFPSTEFFQILTVLSCEPDATNLPDGCMDRQLTGFVCPTHLKGRKECLKFHTLIVESSEADTTCFNEGLKQTSVIA